MRVGSLSQEDSVGQDSLEEEIATHLSILAWRIPWTRETWRAIVNKELDRTEQAPAHTHTHTHTRTTLRLPNHSLPNASGIEAANHGFGCGIHEFSEYLLVP